jgi:hypothetical protein
MIFSAKFLSKSRFVIPVMPKAGLAHSLFTWAEAYRQSLLNNAIFIHHHWLRFRIGPYLRREREKMLYRKIMKTPQWGMSPYFGRLIMRFLEPVHDRKQRLQDGQVLVIRDNFPHSFEKFFGMKTVLKDALFSISNDRFIKSPPRTEPFICVEYRSGDYKFIAKRSGFLELDKRTQRSLNQWSYTPLDFFIEVALTLRDIAGRKVPIVLSTDAYLDEVRPLLDLGNVTLARDDSALLKLLDMSQASVSVMGSSNFAAWSWFLGDSFAIFPLGRQSFFHGLGLANLPQATYLFDNETELQLPHIRDEIKLRLNSDSR